MSAAVSDAAASGADPAFLEEWAQMDLSHIFGFPLWEKDVHDVLQPQFKELQSIFQA